MAMVIPIEDVLKEQVERINELQMITTLIQSKDDLEDTLVEVQDDISTMKTGILSMKNNLDKMKEHNVALRKLMAMYNQLDQKITHMSDNIPQSLIQQLKKSEERQIQEVAVTKPHTKVSKEPSIATDFNFTNVEDMAEEFSSITDCKKSLFTEPEDSYSIEPVDEVEFTKIPKYLIGRQPLAALNGLIVTINQIMKFKYRLLALGKVGARKKGELDLFLQFKREESDLAASGIDGKIYFFNADDYVRETKSKLDKSKLNLLTVLRHCKRIHEIRLGKNVKYQVVTSS